MTDYLAQQQAWEQAVRQQQAAQQQKINAEIQGLTYQQAPLNPASYGPDTRLANALTGPAGGPNNPATNLFAATNPFNFALARYMMEAPGGNTIGLPTDGDQIGGNSIDSSNPVLMALLSRSGVG